MTGNVTGGLFVFSGGGKGSCAWAAGVSSRTGGDCLLSEWIGGRGGVVFSRITAKKQNHAINPSYHFLASF